MEAGLRRAARWGEGLEASTICRTLIEMTIVGEQTGELRARWKPWACSTTTRRSA